MPKEERRPGLLSRLPRPVAIATTVVLVVVGLIAISVGVRLLLRVEIALLSTLSGHAPRRLAWILAGTYAVALVSFVMRMSVQVRWLRAVLLVPFVVGVALFVGLMPGRLIDRGAADRAVSAEFGNGAPFAEIVIWVTLTMAFVWVGTLVVSAFLGRWGWTALIPGVAALLGFTGLVVHLNAPGAEGDAPESVNAYIARHVHPDDTFSVSGLSGAELRFTDVDLVICRQAVARIRPTASLPDCRDGLTLTATGQAGDVRGGEVSCVLLNPDLGHRSSEWRHLLARATPTTSPTDAAFRVSYARDDSVWLTCAENSGALPSSLGDAPLIHAVSRLITSVEVGLL